jgi:hypothetical protein
MGVPSARAACIEANYVKERDAYYLFGLTRELRV